MAFLITPQGRLTEVKPEKDVFTLNELYDLIACETIELYPIFGSRYLVIDEVGRVIGKPVNHVATGFTCINSSGTLIFGNAVLIKHDEID